VEPLATGRDLGIERSSGQIRFRPRKCRLLPSNNSTLDSSERIFKPTTYSGIDPVDDDTAPFELRPSGGTSAGV